MAEADIIENSMGSRPEMPRYQVTIDIMKFDILNPERNNNVSYPSNFTNFDALTIR